MAGFLSETAPKIAYKWTTSPISDIKQQMMLVAEVYGGKVQMIRGGAMCVISLLTSVPVRAERRQ